MTYLTRVLLISAAAVMASGSCGQVARAEEAESGAAAPDLAQGRVVYERWCVHCHAPHGAMSGTIALDAKYEGRIPPALIHRTDLNPDVVAAWSGCGYATEAQGHGRS